MDNSELIIVLNRISYELSKISDNTTKELLSIGVLLSTFLGALVAGILGILASVYLEKRREKASNRIALKTIAEEMEASLNAFDRAREFNMKDGKPYVTHLTVMQSPILVSDSYSSFKPSIINLLDDEMFTYVNDFYVNVRKLDNLMSEVIQKQEYVLMHSVNKEFETATVEQLKLYWVLITSKQSENIILNGKKVVEKIKQILKINK